MLEWSAGDLVWIPAHTQGVGYTLDKKYVRNMFKLRDPIWGLLLEVVPDPPSQNNRVKVLVSTPQGPQKYFFNKKDLYKASKEE